MTAETCVVHPTAESTRPESVTKPTGKVSPRLVASPRWLAILLAVTSAVGLVAATALTIDKLALLRHPGAGLACNISPLVGCGKGLESWQGALLQFPNSIIGMGCWSGVLVVSTLLLAGAGLPKAGWIGLNVGLAGAFMLVVFLIGQSIYVLGILCPWCMVTWAITIPAFLAISLFNLATWPRNIRVREAARRTVQWLPLITLVCLILIAALAQWRLNVLGSL